MNKIEIIKAHADRLHNWDRNGTWDIVIKDLAEGNLTEQNLIEAMIDTYNGHKANNPNDANFLTHIKGWIAELVKIDLSDDTKLTELRIKHIVDFMVKEGTEETSTGNWVFEYDELTCGNQFVDDYRDEIVEELVNRPEVAEVYMDNCNFDITFYTDYCLDAE